MESQLLTYLNTSWKEPWYIILDEAHIKLCDLRCFIKVIINWYTIIKKIIIGKL